MNLNHQGTTERGRVPPHNLVAEEALLGAMLFTGTAIEAALAFQLTPDSFYKPAHGHVFDAICELYSPGPNPLQTGADPVTVAEHLRRRGLLDACGGRRFLAQLMAGVSSQNPSRYARIISELAFFRGLIFGAGEIAELSYGQPDDVDAALEKADLIFNEVRDRKAVIVPDGLTTLDELLAKKHLLGDDFAPWLIPDVIKRTTRVVIVSVSGIGKSTLLQQIWISAAAGLHPFTHDYLPNPIRVLFIDLENPEERIVDEYCEAMYTEARRLAGDEWQPDRCALWPQQRPMDITTPRDRAQLEAAIKMTTPDLVLIGPLYRLATMEGTQGLQNAAKVMAVLDDLRTKYGFGLIIESHAPSTRNGDPLRVRGSEQWNYWPEVSIALTEIEGDLDAPVSEPMPKRFQTRRTRGDRVKVSGWPGTIRHSTGRDGPWPWVVVESEDPNAF